MEDKICQCCGRYFEYRKKWEANWEGIRYCSQRCSKQGSKNLYSKKILELLRERSKGKTICPSEVLVGEEKKNKFKMERVRQAARLLAHQEIIEITQKGKKVCSQSFKGPIRLKLK